MRRSDLPERWLKRLEQYTDEKYGPDFKYRGTLSTADFPSNSLVHIRLTDGSQAFFNFAFIIEAPEWEEIAVFTEHSGYHIFPLFDTERGQYELRVDTTEEDN